ncbi:hypothetical protein [Puniceibacterium sediminis]|uniref:Relaxasome subunit MobC n=1 Tax=Puniceibacterium sediminis TaxID=1608407 RepID=A0A238VLP7_9RHOB|nr:hypothetical protein [Puniceibacterium sediminis]SNR35047.1 hypothetical protein SAMN06265370_102340 [Puniceibacterium sediminis]
MATLETQIAQAQNRLKDLQVRARKISRTEDTRRKILYGASVLRLLREADETKSLKLRELLDERIEREKDREFLGLRPLKRATAVVTEP